MSDERETEDLSFTRWTPGRRGKFLIDIRGVLRHWLIDDDGLPSHADVRVPLGIDSLMEGEIEPSGSCWATMRDASAGPALVSQAFASVSGDGLRYEGRREPRPPGPAAERRWGRDPGRIPMILAAIEREWAKQPDIRLGQLFVNLLRMNTSIPAAEEGKVLFNVADGQLLRWLGPETEEEETYIREEPRRAREGWREWERAFRASEYYKRRYAARDHDRRGERDDDEGESTGAADG